MKKVILIVLAVLVLAAGIAAFGILLPYSGAESTMPEGSFALQQTASGLVLSWPEGSGADFYRLEILEEATGAEEAPVCLYTVDTKAHENLLLPELPDDRPLTIRVNSMVNYKVFGNEKLRVGNAPLEVSARLEAPAITQLEWTADPETQRVTVTFRMAEGDTCQAFLMDEAGNATPLRVLTENQWVIEFGSDGELSVPAYGKTCRVCLSASRELTGLSIQGAVSAEFSIQREDLLGRNLNAALTDAGNNAVSLTWEETKGEYFEVQTMNAAGEWTPVCKIRRGEPLTYLSGQLQAFREYTFRVVAVGGQTMEGSDYAAESETLTFKTKESSIYARVWPVKKLDAYADAEKTEVLGTVEAGDGFCVVREENGMFGVKVGNQIWYIDSNYCMINLPDYLGELCSYQITNSYNSIYLVHGFRIPRVSGVITSGYEYVRQDDGSFLVPLLYPSAKKLLLAAESAISQGYRLKIYDAFRPQEATREIFNRTSEILDDEIPKKTQDGVSASRMDLPAPPEGEERTYRLVMTAGSYDLNSFLAQGTSRHNLGVALDLTLEDLETGKELEMQTDIHDLSWYSVTYRNNSNAKTLASIMKEAGFAALSTEWWHFQDNDATAKLALRAVWGGISGEGWHWDEDGWHYRDSWGSFLKDREVVIDGQTYRFDGNGNLGYA